MNWNEKAAKAAVKSRHALYEEDEDGHEFWGFSSQSDAQDHGFEEGAKWQRDQLRTDEAVERVARAIARLDHGEEWPDETIIDDEYRAECHETALAAINALLGDT